MTIREEYDKKLLELKVWRAQRILELRANHSVLEIAAIEGVSHPTLRLWLTQGVADSFMRKRRESKGLEVAMFDLERRQAHAQRVFGCSWEEVQNLTGIQSWVRSRSHPLLKMYWCHKNTAQRVKQSWSISLPEYASVVRPHLAEIGRFKGAKVLGRINKALPWTPENIHIITLEENSFNTNGFAKARAKTKKRIAQAVALEAAGRTLEEIAKQMRKSRSQIANYLQMARVTA